jgi:CheY-specific phosphatase CheX
MGPILDEFAAVVLRCLHTTVGIDAVIEPPGPASTQPTICVTIDLRGALCGPVTWRFPQDVALELVRRLMDDPDPELEIAVDGALELANILTGRASLAFERGGLRCELGVPRRHEGALPSGVAIHMRSAGGEIAMVLSLRGAE